MKLSEKIINLRKSNGMSQEDLADKLHVSRQAISRWESGSAMPDATNIVEISKLFNVTTDYLLVEDYESDYDLPLIKKEKESNFNQIMIYLITLEVMILIIEFMATFILQNAFFAILSFIPFVAAIGGFEYAYQKHKLENNTKTNLFRKKFYKISTWLGLYFPIRFVITTAMHLYPRPYSTLVLECIILIIYIGSSLFLNILLEKNYIQ